jgi:hypothetical protein
MYNIGQDLQQALAHKDLFLMTGRANEVASMASKLAGAHQSLIDLIAQLSKELSE